MCIRHSYKCALCYGEFCDHIEPCHTIRLVEDAKGQVDPQMRMDHSVLPHTRDGIYYDFTMGFLPVDEHPRSYCAWCRGDPGPKTFPIPRRRGALQDVGYVENDPRTGGPRYVVREYSEQQEMLRMRDMMQAQRRADQIAFANELARVREEREANRQKNDDRHAVIEKMLADDKMRETEEQMGRRQVQEIISESSSDTTFRSSTVRSGTATAK